DPERTLWTSLAALWETGDPPERVDSRPGCSSLDNYDPPVSARCYLSDQESDEPIISQAQSRRRSRSAGIGKHCVHGRARSMRRHARFLLWSSVLLMAALLPAVIWSLTLPAPPLRECRLPDGTSLRLEAISSGWVAPVIPRHGRTIELRLYSAEQTA